MELALSLGDTPKPFSFLGKPQKILGEEIGFCMAVDKGVSADGENNGRNNEPGFSDGPRRDSSSDPPVQLDLLPFSPVNKSQPSSNKFPFTWLNEKFGGDPGRSGLEINQKLGDETDPEGPSLSSPSTVSSFQMDFSIFGSIARGNKRDFEQIIINNNNDNNSNGENEADRGTPSRGSDEEENGLIGRKKLRLSKEQSAFLEESFKEHSTLNPKQKLALSKQLSLSPRQVEVWFQNRRARTKLKQTEVDCEYLKKWCETLTDENRRLQKELQELRALKASQPFYMQLPATTLTMCPSCERVATSGAALAQATAVVSNNKAFKHFPLSSSHDDNAQQTS